MIAFTRDAGGLTCSATQTFVHEQGVRGIVLESGIDGVPAIILSTKPLSSSCRVSKQPKTVRNDASGVQ